MNCRGGLYSRFVIFPLVVQRRKYIFILGHLNNKTYHKYSLDILGLKCFPYLLACEAERRGSSLLISQQLIANEISTSQITAAQHHVIISAKYLGYSSFHMLIFIFCSANNDVS